MPIPIEEFLNLIFSLWDLLKGAFILSVIFFLLLILGSRIHRIFAKKTGFSWIVSVAIVSFIFSFVFFAFVYFVPFLLAIPRESLGVKPPELSLGFFDFLRIFAFGTAKVLLVSAFFSLFSIPFIILGSFVFKYLLSRKFNRNVCLFVSTYICCVIAFAMFIFFFKWVFVGVIFFLYSS